MIFWLVWGGFLLLLDGRWEHFSTGEEKVEGISDDAAFPDIPITHQQIPEELLLSFLLRW